MFSLTSKRPLMSLLWSRSCRQILESAKGLATKAGSTSNTSDSAHQKERSESGPESTENQELQFAASRRGSFFQVEPKLGNQFSRDVFLASYLERVLPGDVRGIDLGSWGPVVNILYYRLSIFSTAWLGLKINRLPGSKKFQPVLHLCEFLFNNCLY